jgi:hypothetical protein
MARRCDWFLERCAEIIDEEKLVEFVGRVAAGREQDHRISRVATVVKIPASIHDRLEAFRMLAEWGIGKPIQVVITNPNITPNDSVRSAQQIFDMIKKLEDDSKELVPARGGNGRH